MKFHLPTPLASLLGVARLSTASAADVSPAQPEIPARTFDLKDFGAGGDAGATVNTGAFERAVAAVSRAGGGTLLVPAGTYFTGPFDLCSRIDLRLQAGATILFSPHFDDYQVGGSKEYRPMIRIDGAHDVTISGPGTIDGNGEAWWPEARRFKAEADARHARSNTSPRPAMVAFRGCRRIRVEGVTLTQAPAFNLAAFDCKDITVEGVMILNPADSLNTDGIDPKNDQRVLISRCRIDTGDDCIALGGSAGPLEKDILITDCIFLHGHGCSIGSGTSGGVRNVLVRRCTFDGTDTGVRLKSARDRGGLVENVVYEDLTMKHVGVAVSISDYYDNTPIDRTLGEDRSQPVTALTPRWRNIVVRNLTATAGRVRAGLVAGLPEMPVEDITFDHVTIEAPRGLRISQARNITLRDVHIVVAKGHGVISDDSVQGLTRTD